MSIQYHCDICKGLIEPPYKVVVLMIQVEARPSCYSAQEFYIHGHALCLKEWLPSDTGDFLQFHNVEDWPPMPDFSNLDPS